MGRFVLPLAQVFTSSGKLGAGYRLSFFETGTSTHLDTYSNAGRTVTNSNPVIADAEGRFDDIYLADQPYKVTLADADGVEVWSADPVQTAVGEIGFPVPIASGGTGSTTAAGARTALGLGSAAEYDVGDGADEVPTNSMVSGVPTGAIIMWNGATGDVPAGWALCDGGTYSKSDGSGVITAPDLRNRFIVGAGDTYAAKATGGAASATTSTGGGGGTVTTSAAGAHSHGGVTQGHALTTAQIPPHNHKMFANVGLTSQSSGTYANIGWFPSHNSQYGIQGGETIASVYQTADNTGGGGSHTHGIDAAPDHTHTIETSDHTHTVATIPPFLALVFIIKL